ATKEKKNIILFLPCLYLHHALQIPLLVNPILHLLSFYTCSSAGVRGKLLLKAVNHRLICSKEQRKRNKEYCCYYYYYR
ncbi:hypothetical protein J3Q64DRAFT_1719104, partial [Phycomyces blakesleeanus]